MGAGGTRVNTTSMQSRDLPRGVVKPREPDGGNAALQTSLRWSARTRGTSRPNMHDDQNERTGFRLGPAPPIERNVDIQRSGQQIASASAFNAAVNLSPPASTMYIDSGISGGETPDRSDARPVPNARHDPAPPFENARSVRDFSVASLPDWTSEAPGGTIGSGAPLYEGAIEMDRRGLNENGILKSSDADDLAEPHMYRQKSNYVATSPRRGRPSVARLWNADKAKALPVESSTLRSRTPQMIVQSNEHPSVDDHPPTTPLAPPRRRYKKYETYRYQDIKFFCGGRLMTGGDSLLPMIASVILLLGLGGLWLGTTGVWMWRDGLGGGGAGAGGKAAVIIFGYLLGVCFGAMMATAFRDPGILPRNLDPSPPTAFHASTGSLIPLSRDIQVRRGTVNVNIHWALTCLSPDGTQCGNCVEDIDHHCTYLHNCVGRRNYTSFATFVISSILCLVHSVVFAALHYAVLCHRENKTFVQALSQSPESAVNFLLGLIFLGPLTALLGYHFMLMFKNATTIEQIPSWIDASGWEVDGDEAG